MIRSMVVESDVAADAGRRYRKYLSLEEGDSDRRGMFGSIFPLTLVRVDVRTTVPLGA